MTGPAADPPPRFGTATFQDLVDGALRHRVAVHETAAFALEMGVFPDQIIAYVRDPGEQTRGSREEMMHTLTTVPWAMGRVIALVKARRDPTSLGARILAHEGEIDPESWGVPGTGDRDADLAMLLDRV